MARPLTLRMLPLPRSPIPLAATATLVLALGLTAQQQDPNERTETYASGAVMLHYHVDADGKLDGNYEAFTESGARTLFAMFSHGQRHGAWREWRADGRKIRMLNYQHDVLHGECEEFHPNGRQQSLGDYRDGKRTGKWVETDASGDRRVSAEYRDGKRNGPLRISYKDKVLSRQVWKDDRLEQLDDLEPFPVPAEQLRAELKAILDAPPPPLDAKDPLAAARQEALRRLQAYRHLCGLPYAEMALVPEWNLRCDAAAEICRRIGHLDHTPPKPDGMDDARYRLGAEGAGHSNLSINATLARSVDSYMDDSDASNIDRIGHRRWCLNPAMKKTGFGSDDHYHAMWSMDESGGTAKGLPAVYYPPRGYTPIDMFSPNRAFSIALLKGSVPKKEELQADIHVLDDDYLPLGAPLEMDHCDVAAGGYGGLACLVFRAKGLVVAAGRKYLVEVSYDKGKTFEHRYVVEFCAAVAP